MSGGAPARAGPAAGRQWTVLHDLFPPGIQHALDLAGIFVFATAGALLAVRKNFDVFGIAVLALVTALGGGLFRDLVIGATPAAAFGELSFFVTPSSPPRSSSSCTPKSPASTAPSTSSTRPASPCSA